MSPRDERQLLTVLFTDIVSSTDVAASLGDARWKTLLARHHAVVRQELKRSRGHEIDTAGDGFFATFASPVDGVRCAGAIVMAVRELGLQIRAGLHFGEVEPMGPKVAGIAVVTASRIAGLAGPGEVLVSGTIHELVAGSDVTFVDRGDHDLKGVPGSKRLYAVAGIHGHTLGEPLPPQEAEARRTLAVTGSRAAHRRGWIAAALVALLVVGAATVLLRGNGGGAHPATGPPLGSMFALRPPSSSPRGVTRITLQQYFYPQMVTGLGSVWILTVDRTYRVDRVGAQPATLPGGADGIAVGSGGVWEIEVSSAASLVELNPLTGAHEKGLTLPERPISVATGFGYVWVGTSASVYRVQPRTLRATRIAVPGGAAGIAVDASGVWAVDGVGAVTRIDLESLRSDAPIELAGADDVVAAYATIWVLDRASGSLIAIDPSGRILQTIPVGRGAVDLASGLDSIWVASQRGVIEQVDPSTKEVQREIDVGSPIGAVTVDGSDGLVWAIAIRTTGLYL